MFYFYFIVFFALCAQNLQAYLEQFFAQYQRPVTVLEISDTQHFYTLGFAPKHRGVFITLCTGEKIDQVKKQVQELNNVVLLHPKEFSAGSVVQLSECEHIDVTLMHDCALLQRNPYLISALLHLGDYLIVEVPRGFYNAYLDDELRSLIFHRELRNHGFERLYFKQEKTFLRKARWVMSASAQSKQPSYTILSTFAEKKMIKGSQKKITDWVPGINLVTAIMLGVKYPTNDLLRANIKKFRIIDHNDPVIGNMIVQGRRVQLIDFADGRRNADQEKCLKAALRIFSWVHRPRDPLAMIQKYSEYVTR